MSISRLYIPTYRRLKQPTWNNLPKKWKDRTVLVVDKEDAEKLGKDHSVLVCPMQGQGIPKVRKWIMDKEREHGNGAKFGVLDDDIVDFCKTKRFAEEPGLWNTRLSDVEYDDMFGLMSDYLDKVVTCGLEVCWNPPISKMDFHNCFRQTVNHFFNGKTFPYDLIDWDVELTEDYYMILQLLTNGYRNYVSLRYRIRPDVTQASGGCAPTRTIKKHNESMEFIRDKFPKFVKLYSKAQKTGKEWAGKDKLAAEIMWKNAFKSSQVESESTLESFFA